MLHRRGYVITSKEMGVLLGIVFDPMKSMPTGVWSRSPAVMPFMPDCALCFMTSAAALYFAAQFEPVPLGIEVVEVEADIHLEPYDFASIESCARAGLERWITLDSDTFNTIPI